jgi:hypothetical protein
MPPKSKAPTHIEHNVYLTSSVTFDNDKDDFGRLQIYQAFTSLDEANEFCEAKVDELALKLDIEAPTPTLDNINNDGTFRMELPLENRNRDVIVETLIMPLMGGIIMHDKPVSRKTPKSKKTIKSKAKAKNSQASDEEEEKPDQDIDMDDGPVSPKTTKANSRKNSKGSKQDVDAVKRDSAVDPSAVTEADIAAAPAGSADCLKYWSSITVFGHHEHWSEAQLKVIGKTFGVKVNKTLPVYNNVPMHQLVLGTDVPSNVLRRIKTKEFKPITPNEFLARIRSVPVLPDQPAVHQFTKEEVAKLCKKVPGKPVVRTRIVKKEESDSDVDVKDSNDVESADEEL